MVDSKWEISFVRTTTYNNKGQIAEVEEKDNGDITRIEYTYDDFGNRTARLKSTNGQSVYGERWFFSVREGIDEIFSDKQNISKPAKCCITVSYTSFATTPSTPLTAKRYVKRQRDTLSGKEIR